MTVSEYAVGIAQRVLDAIIDIKNATGELPTVIEMNPQDWQALCDDRSETFDGYKGRLADAKSRLWNVPIRENSAIQLGQFELR